MINTDRLVQSFLSLSLIDGIHGNEKEVAQEILRRCNALGMESHMDNAGSTFGGNTGNIHTRLKGTIDAQPVLLCAHMDTIQSTKNLKHVLQNGIIATDGTTILGGDDRSGLAIIFEILQTIHDKKIPHGPIEVLCTVCEEAGMHGAKYIKRSDFSAPFGFVFDCQASPGNYIVEAPGAVSFKAAVRGRSAHAAVSPEKGIHAIEIASKAIATLKLGRWDHTGMMNIGTIHGGTSINVVPDLVEITGETRNANEEKLLYQIEYIKKAFHTVAAELGGSVDLTFTEKYGGYQFNDDSPMIRIASAAIREAGLEPTPLKYAGGSDANVLNKNGIPMLNLGVGFKNAHSFQEYIAVEDLVTTARIGLNIVRTIAKNENIISESTTIDSSSH
jgi:tripeptide aminopeptidase